MDNSNQIPPQRPRVVIFISVRVPAQQLEPVVDNISPSNLNSSNTNSMPSQQISSNQTQIFYNLEQQIRSFWMNEMRMIAQTVHFRHHILPLSHVRRIMKYNPEVRMISAGAPIIFAKACEIFISELTMRSWVHAELHGRRTLEKSDIKNAILRTKIYDFLEYIISRDEDDFPFAAVPPYYYDMSHEANVGGVGTMTGQEGEQTTAPYAGQQQQVPLEFWEHWLELNMDQPPSGSR